MNIMDKRIVVESKDLSYKISIDDLEIIKSYLNEKFKISYGGYNNHKSTIYQMLNYIRKPIKLIDMLDIKEYFEKVIEKKINYRTKKPLTVDTKNTYRSYLRSFFDYVIAYYLNKKIKHENPVPNKRIFQFTCQVGDIKKQEDESKETFSKEELIYILEKAKKKNYRDFIIFSLLIHCGMRIKECLTIRIENINFQERFLETGFEKGARKTTLNTKKSLKFFFSKTFKIYLLKYINYRNSKQGWLFPGRTTHYKSFRKKIKKCDFYENKFSYFHRFRKTLITNRINMGCPLHISEILTNHTPSSTQGKSYIKKSIEVKRRDFDTWNPYKDFAYF